MPLPSRAETGTTAWKSYRAEYWAICSIMGLLSSNRSILLMASTAGIFPFLNRRISSSSALERGAPASVTSRQASTPSTVVVTDFII